MIKAKNFMMLPVDVRKKVDNFILEYIDVEESRSFDDNGYLVESIYQRAFKMLINEDIFTVKELRQTFFIDYHVLLPIEWFE